MNNYNPHRMLVL